MLRAAVPAFAPFVFCGAVLCGAPVHAAGDVEAGHRLATKWCSACHAVGAATTATDKADPLTALARDPQVTPEHLRGFLAKPHGRMPELSLSNQEIEDLIAYMESLK